MWLVKFDLITERWCSVELDPYEVAFYADCQAYSRTPQIRKPRTWSYDYELKFGDPPIRNRGVAAIAVTPDYGQSQIRAFLRQQMKEENRA
jgi:hypothetical protein